jgi:CDP-diacylglycerol--serine O-phosphatidyltransferase
VAPAVLVFAAYVPPESFQDLALSTRAESIVGRSGSFAGIIFAVCAALRLARYNTFQSGRRDSFVGLPSPAAGATIATFVLFLQYFEGGLEGMKFGALAYYALSPMAIALALLMVSRVLYPRNRLKAFVLKPRHAFTALGVYAFVIAVLHYALTTSWAIVLFPVTAAYVLFGLADTTHMKLTRRVVEDASAPPAPPLGSGDAAKQDGAR